MRRRRSTYRRRRRLRDVLRQLRVSTPLGLQRRPPPPSGTQRPISPLAAEHRTTGEQPGARFTIRLAGTLFIVACLFSALLVRLWSIQVVNGKTFRNAASDITTRTVTLNSPRGSIVTRSGAVLAGEESSEVISISQDSAKLHPGTVSRLAALLGTSTKALGDIIATVQYEPYQPVPIATNVPIDDVATIDANPSEFPGVTVTEQYERTYPYDALSAQTLGYLTPITQSEFNAYGGAGYTAQSLFGQTGLEDEYEQYLRGKPGTELLSVDPLGDVVSQHETNAPTPGDTLVTNFDLGVDETLNNALASDLTSLHAQGEPAPWAAGVVLDANTGAVLATASLPSYDNNWWATGGITTDHYSELLKDGSLNNNAISGTQPPGSTFKLVTATAALDDGLITPYTTIDDTGNFYYGGHDFVDTAESTGAGPLDVSQALTASNDHFFYQLGAWFWDDQHRYGVDAIQKVAKNYGLGENPGIDLPGAAAGQVDSPQLRAAQKAQNPGGYPYYGGDNVEMAFGQGETLVSVLQDAEAFATFANGGTRYAPEIGAGVVSPSGKLVARTTPKVLSKVSYAPGTYAAMLAGFQGVVQQTSGTGYAAFVGFPFSKWNIAGKTGTATVSTNDTIPPTAWFVGFGGPKSGGDQYVVAVEVSQAGYGAQASAPVVRSVFNYLIAHPPGAVDLPKTAGS